MEKKVEYQVCYEVVSTIKYLSEEEPGEHYFSLLKEQPEGLWESGEDEAVAFVSKDGSVDVDGYHCILNEAEVSAIKEMMVEILAK